MSILDMNRCQSEKHQTSIYFGNVPCSFLQLSARFLHCWRVTRSCCWRPIDSCL